jgi:hypothetical protein
MGMKMNHYSLQEQASPTTKWRRPGVVAGQGLVSYALPENMLVTLQHGGEVLTT